jgi:predicted AAA+ superfamily ATPase
MIERILAKIIQEQLYTGKVIVLLGARQVGKTTLLKALFDDLPDVLWMNGDELDIQALFENISATRLKAVF